ncbi:hypothetical protein B566_EDAN005317 [Ephemera danica]|nr:hypothetical protein B566_EDAN005317 [Ephemera danica]
MKVLLLLALFVSLAVARNVNSPETAQDYDWSQGGPGGGGGGGAGSEDGPGEDGGDGGGVGGGEGGQGGWGGPVSEGTDEECAAVAAERCPTDRLLPNPQDCGAFCMCQSTIGKFMACANGLHFSESLQMCTWPDEANCPYKIQANGK